MSSVGQTLHGFADLLCQLYDELDEVAVRQHGDRWMCDGDLRSLSLTIFNDVVSGGRPPGRIYTHVVNHADRQGRIFAAIRGLDEGLRWVNPRYATGRTPRGLVGLEAFARVHGRLDSGARGGALLPRLALPRHGPTTIQHKRDVLAYVHRVPDEVWQRIDHQVLGLSRGLRRNLLLGGLNVDCVPAIADATEMTFATREVDGRRVYRIAPADGAATLDRIPEIVAALDRRGTHIAVAPEMTQTPAILERWQQALRDQRPSNLRLVVAGSGDLGPAGARARNTAVLLDGRNGEILGTQDKQYGFDLTTDILSRWRLTSRLGDQPLAEDLAALERRMTVFEAGAVRLGILICEDLDQPLDVGPIVRDVGLSHLLVPVFARPLQRHRWEEAAASKLAREAGTAVVVSNSLVMADILDTVNPGTALLISADAKHALVGRVGGPAEPAGFRLHADGSAGLR